MNITTSQDRDEAQAILDALKKIQESPEMQSEAVSNPESLMDRLGLSGVARHAVALALTAMVVGPAAASSFDPTSFWA